MILKDTVDLGNPLAKAGMTLFLKKESRPLRLTETGAGAAQYAPTRLPYSVTFFDPDLFALGRSQLLSGVRRQQEYHCHSDKQSQSKTLHRPALLLDCAAPGAGRNNEGNRAKALYRKRFAPSSIISIPTKTPREFSARGVLFYMPLNQKRGKVSPPPCFASS